MRDSSRIEPILSNIRYDIVSESGLTRRKLPLEKEFLMKPHETTDSIKNQFVVFRAIRGLCGIGVKQTYFFYFNLLVADDIADAEFYILICRHGNIDLTYLTYFTDLLLLIQHIDG